MNARERELVAICDDYSFPVEGVAPDDNYMITVDRASRLPTRTELKWLSGYRAFREQAEYSASKIEDMYRRAAAGTGYPVMPPHQVCGLWAYRFVKYGDGDWAYTSHGWTMGGSLPRPPQIRERHIACGEICLGPLSMPELLAVVTGDVDPETRLPVPGRRWVDWLSANDPLQVYA